DGRDNPQGYALGWRVHELDVLGGAKKTLVLHHHGVSYGSVSNFAVYPEYGIAVSVMMNKNQGSCGDPPVRLADLFIEATTARRVGRLGLRLRRASRIRHRPVRHDEQVSGQLW